MIKITQLSNLILKELYSQLTPDNYTFSVEIIKKDLSEKFSTNELKITEEEIYRSVSYMHKKGLIELDLKSYDYSIVIKCKLTIYAIELIENSF